VRANRLGEANGYALVSRSLVSSNKSGRRLRNTSKNTAVNAGNDLKIQNAGIGEKTNTDTRGTEYQQVQRRGSLARPRSAGNLKVVEKQRRAYCKWSTSGPARGG